MVSLNLNTTIVILKHPRSSVAIPPRNNLNTTIVILKPQ